MKCLSETFLLFLRYFFAIMLNYVMSICYDVSKFFFFFFFLASLMNDIMLYVK